MIIMESKSLTNRHSIFYYKQHWAITFNEQDAKKSCDLQCFLFDLQELLDWKGRIKLCSQSPSLKLCMSACTQACVHKWSNTHTYKHSAIKLKGHYFKYPVIIFHCVAEVWNLAQICSQLSSIMVQEDGALRNHHWARWWCKQQSIYDCGGKTRAQNFTCDIRKFNDITLGPNFTTILLKIITNLPYYGQVITLPHTISLKPLSWRSEPWHPALK